MEIDFASEWNEEDSVCEDAESDVDEESCKFVCVSVIYRPVDTLRSSPSLSPRQSLKTTPSRDLDLARARRPGPEEVGSANKVM